MNPSVGPSAVPSTGPSAAPTESPSSSPTFAPSAKSIKETSNCTANVGPDSCYEFTYNSFTINGALTTLSFSVQVNCKYALSHVAVELPAGLSPSQVTNLHNANPLFTYSNNVGTNNPFYSVKWDAISDDSYKYGAMDTFYMTIPTTAFNSYGDLRVEAKASTLYERVTFSPTDSCVNAQT
eukprot:gene37561-42544_t